MEGAPKIPIPEAANSNEAPGVERELTQELMDESIEKAGELIDALKQFDQIDEEGRFIALNRQSWQEAGVLSAELKETLKYVPAAECLQHGLPYHPTDEKYEYPQAVLPDQPEYPLPYDSKVGDEVRVGQEQIAA